MFDFQFYTTTNFQIDKMELKNRDEIKLERVHFSHENKILTDLVQQARDSPNLVGLTDDQLLEKVENILLEKIQNGEKQAYFQLGLFYYEQVCGFCLQIQAHFPIPIAWLASFSHFCSKWLHYFYSYYVINLMGIFVSDIMVTRTDQKVPYHGLIPNQWVIKLVLYHWTIYLSHTEFVFVFQ